MFIFQSDSNSDEDHSPVKIKKVTGIRGRRGLKKKSSLQTKAEQAPATKTQTSIYSTKVSKCFDHMRAHDYDDELEDAKKDTIERGNRLKA